MEEEDIFDIFGDEFEDNSRAPKKRRMEDVEEQIITDNESRAKHLLSQLEKAVAEIEEPKVEEPEITVESEIVEISAETSVKEEPKKDADISFEKSFREIPRVQILSLPAVGCIHQVAVPPNHTYVAPAPLCPPNTALGIFPFSHWD
ncbi:hypothetical protein D917_08140 [Trichinella nativa]|uniref:Uncharacterized protein n=1 Tax=Trichinella nativa TaxID=6335 RepID=A0A1Y3EQU0_9BILA|nr:hypothetical protein D917_08140 [Trichinella nativa]